MKIKGSSYFLIVIVLTMSFVVGWSLLMMPAFESKLLPIVFGSVILFLALIRLRIEIRGSDEPESTVTGGETSETEVVGDQLRRSLPHLAWLAGLVSGVYLLGYLISLPIFIFSYMKWLGARWFVASASAVLFPAITYLGLKFGLDVELYGGVLGWL